MPRSKQVKNDIIDARILALHQLIADKVIAEPALIEKAFNTLQVRYESKLMRYGSYLLWQSILESYHDESLFRSLLLASDARTARLRRETIFAGVLTEEERRTVLDKQF